MPATKSLTARFARCCTCHEICTSTFTKCCACREIYTARFTKRCACHEFCASRFTKCCTCHESALRRSPIAAPATKSANEPHVQQSRFTAPLTKSELLDDHHHVQSAAPAMKTAFRSKTAPIPSTCHENRLASTKTRGKVPLRLPRKVITTCENAHGATTRAQSLEAPARGTHIV